MKDLGPLRLHTLDDAGRVNAASPTHWRLSTAYPLDARGALYVLVPIPSRDWLSAAAYAAYWREAVRSLQYLADHPETDL